jgi:hypothetical protein
MPGFNAFQRHSYGIDYPLHLIRNVDRFASIAEDYAEWSAVFKVMRSVMVAHVWNRLPTSVFFAAEIIVFYVQDHDGSQTIAPEVPFDYGEECARVADDSKNFEAAASDSALENPRFAESGSKSDAVIRSASNIAT